MPEHDPERWREAFQAATAQWGLPPGLLEKVAEVESGFDPEAISPAGAVGLMQIIPRFHPDVDPTDPVASINYAGRYLSELKDRFGTWELALAAYNAGPTNVRRHGGIPPFEETQNYVQRISSEVPLTTETPTRLDREVHGMLEGRRALPDATRVSIPEQVETRSLMDEVQRMMAEPDATRVSPQVTSPNLLQQISSRLPEAPVGMQALFDRDAPAHEAMRDFFAPERRENLPDPLQQLVGLAEDPAAGMVGSVLGPAGHVPGTVSRLSNLARRATPAGGSPTPKNQVVIFNRNFREAKTPQQMDAADQHHSFAFSEDALRVSKDDGALAFVNPAGEVTVTLAPRSPLTNQDIVRNLREADMLTDNVTVIRQTPGAGTPDNVERLGGPSSNLLATGGRRTASTRIDPDAITDQDFRLRMRDLATRVEADELMASFDPPSGLGKTVDKIYNAIESFGETIGAHLPDERTPEHIILSWAMTASGVAVREAQRVLKARDTSIPEVLRDALLDLIRRGEDEDES